MGQNLHKSGEGPFQLEGVDEMYARIERYHPHRSLGGDAGCEVTIRNFDSKRQARPTNAGKTSLLGRIAESRLSWLALIGLSAGAVYWNVVLLSH